MSSSECSAADHSATREITEKLQQKMARIARKILVLSGKGGVGKSTVAANLAFALSETGKKVGLLDVDIHGPSIPRMVGLAGQQCFADDGEIIPLALSETLCVMSIAFLLSDNRQAVIWRGPMKYSVIQKLLAETNWGDLDYLIIDAPPGTGDEPLSVAQLVGSSSIAVIVTTPQTVAVEDVRRCITFCEQVGLPIHGLVENMAYLTCPHCQKTIELFGRNGGAILSAESGVPLLGSIPIDPAIVVGGDSGVGIAHAATMQQTKDAFAKILQALRDVEEPVPTSTQETFPMKIAIPLAGGKLSMHFGHCEQFALLQIDPTTQTVTDTQLLVPPPHEPGVLPKWLAEQGATVILAGGMGQRAQQLFIQNGIEVRVGAPASTPEELAQAYLAGSLVTGENVCDH